MYKVAKTKVLGEGAVPADVVFIGEGPGHGEDVLGRPFVGDSGILLRKMINVMQAAVGEFTYFITNLVCCHPANTLGGDNRAPAIEEIGACLPRLKDEISIVQPKAIIALGEVPKKALLKVYPDVRFVNHPAYALRRGARKLTGSFYMTWYRQFETALAGIGGGRRNAKK